MGTSKEKGWYLHHDSFVIVQVIKIDVDFARRSKHQKHFQNAYFIQTIQNVCNCSKKPLLHVTGNTLTNVDRNEV